MAMETQVMTITPDMAREWLKLNMKYNRPVMKSTVHGYARQMRNGTWSLTHQGIAFDENGALIDGQHRLNAIIEANVPVQMNVTKNVCRKDGEVFTIDMGRKRTYANVIQMGGITDPVYKNTGTYVSAFIRYKLPGDRRADPAEIADYIDRHYDELARLDMYCGNGSHTHGKGEGHKRIPAIVSAALLAAIYRGESDDALYRFCEVYRSNDVSQCQKYNPKHALNLRDYVRSYRPSRDVYMRCESSIYAFAHNMERFRLRDNCYPLIAELDQ